MAGLAGGGNAILLLLTALGFAGALIIALVASRRHKPAIARTFLGGAAIVALAYGGSVIAASAASTEETLAPGETKWFCGFYIDCHLGLSVDGAETAVELSGPNGPVKSSGSFHILTLSLHNSAKNPGIAMLLYRPDAQIVDASGRRYLRSAEGEAAVTSSARPTPLGIETRVAHDQLQATIVFDLPTGVQSPRLIVTEGWILDRTIELGLIGDENSILHKRTYQALNASDSRIASATNR